MNYKSCCGIHSFRDRATSRDLVAADANSSPHLGACFGSAPGRQSGEGPGFTPASAVTLSPLPPVPEEVGRDAVRHSDCQVLYGGLRQMSVSCGRLQIRVTKKATNRREALPPPQASGKHRCVIHILVATGDICKVTLWFIKPSGVRRFTAEPILWKISTS